MPGTTTPQRNKPRAELDLELCSPNGQLLNLPSPEVTP